MSNRIVVIIPAFNESKHITEVIRGMRSYIRKTIVVDDGSTDNTYQLAMKEGATVLKHVVNLGKGAALRTGVEYAKALGFKEVIFMDADAQHNPDDLKHFVAYLARYELVVGVRKLNFKDSGVRFLGNKINAWLINLLFGQRISDPICGFRAFKISLYPKIKWESSGYGVETEMVIRAIRNKIKIVEIPIASIYLDKYKGVSILDAYKIFFDVIKWRLSI